MKHPLLRIGHAIAQSLWIGGLYLGTLALGGAWGWGFALLFIAFAAAFCLETALRCAAPPQAPCALPRWTGLAVLAITAFLLFQMLPLPAGLVGLISPHRLALDREIRTALEAPASRFLPLAADTAAAQSALASWALGLMALLLGAWQGAVRPRVRRLLPWLFALVLFEALYGLFENLTGRHRIFWIPAATSAQGTFFNRNHYAAFLSLFLPVLIGWFYHRAQPADRAEAGLPPLAAREILSTRAGLWLLAPILLVLGIIQSASRGGTSSMILGTALFFALGARNRSVRSFSWAAVLLGAALLVYAANSDYQVVLDRFGAVAAGGDGRMEIWRDAVKIVRDFPLVGVGAGGFSKLFSRYATTDTFSFPFQAHNEWLEGLISFGAAGMLLVAASVAALFRSGLRRVRAGRRDQPWLLGIWCGLAGFAVHCFTDFNLHIPSLLICAFLLAGILLGFDTVTPPRRRIHRHSQTEDD